MYYLFRHLFYLSIFACIGLLMLGFAFEKLVDNTTAVAFFGFTAFVVHLAAFWFVMAPTSPMRNTIYCLVLLIGCLTSVALGRWFQVILSEGSIEQWWNNVMFIARAAPVWWLLLVIETIIIKEVFRWRLHVRDQLLTQQLSIIELFGLTLTLGIVLGFSSSTLLILSQTQYVWIAALSSFVHVVICLPFAYILLTRSKTGAGSSFIFGCCALIGLGLFYIASFRFLSGNLHSFADLAIGLTSFAGPFVLAILFAREKHMHIISDWERTWTRLKSVENSADDHTLLK